MVIMIFIIKAVGDMGEIHERVETYGVSSLSDAEVIAVALSMDVDKVRDVMSRTDSKLNELRRVGVSELVSVYGMTSVQASKVRCLFDLCKRIGMEDAGVRNKIQSSRDAFGYVRHLCHEPVEHFVVLCLNRANHYKGMFTVSVGSACGTVVEAKEVMRELMMRRSEAFIMVHNHPSGNIKPSDSDKALTKRIAEMGKLHNIQMLDHMIVGYDGVEKFYSFSDEGLTI